MTDRRPIGIIDSGIGGFSVVRQLQHVLPQEDLLYFGDGANTPYGNHDGETILSLTRYMLSFLQTRQVKLLLVACNTISCLMDQFRQEVSCPVLGVVQAGAEAAARRPEGRIGVVSTCFTHSTGCYPQAIAQLAPEKEVFSYGCANLARLVEENLGVPEGQPLIIQELREDFRPPVEQDCVGVCVLGCTHFPLVEDQIHALYPHLILIDPAQGMAEHTRDLLTRSGLAAPPDRSGGLTIYTTADPADYRQKAERAGLIRLVGVEYCPPMALPQPPSQTRGE